MQVASSGSTRTEQRVKMNSPRKGDMLRPCLRNIALSYGSQLQHSTPDGVGRGSAVLL